MKICSFCGLKENDHREIIRGINGTMICENCVDVCIEKLIIQKKHSNKEVKQDAGQMLDNFLKVDDFLSDLNDDIENDKNNKIIKEKQAKKDLKTNNDTFFVYDDNETDPFDTDYNFKEEEFENREEEIKTMKKSFKDFTPSKLKKELDEYIIGQNNAKKILSVAVYNHYKRIQSNKNINKGNVLMVGPTGSGKTYILQKLSEIIEVPLLIVDATSFTEAGYAGADVEDIIQDLYAKAGYDKDIAEKGIVYIDEIDKIASKKQDVTSSLDVGGVGVQQSLLKIIEGSEIGVSPPNSNDFMMQDDIKIDTTNILFVCGGAFSEFNLKKKVEKNSIGFGANIKSKEKVDKDSFYGDTLTQDDIVQYGFIPEFVGRVPIIVQLNKLSELDLVDILTKPKDSIINEYKDLLSMDDKTLIFEEDALLFIAKEALDKNIGARGLRGVIEEEMYNIMFDAPDSEEKEIIITQELLQKGTKS